MSKTPKFRVTYEIDGVRVSNVIDPATSDLFWLYNVQKSVAYDWGWKLLRERFPDPVRNPSVSEVKSVCKLISIEEVGK